MGRKRGYKWQGKPCEIEFGFCRVTYSEKRPNAWYNYEIATQLNGNNYALVEAILIVTEDEMFCIGNEYGIGIYKLRKGGKKTIKHYVLPIDTFKPHNRFEELDLANTFSLDRYDEYTRAIEKWKKEYNGDPTSIRVSELLR